MRITVAILVGMTLMCSCASKEETMFRLLDPKESNVDFENRLFQTDQLNIITLDYFYNGGGVAIADFNNDGLSDLFFTGNMVPNKLYINRGNLQFEDLSSSAGIGGFDQWKSGVAVADVNNDGWADVYVCSTISPDSTRRKNMMFINQGIGEDGHVSFIDKASEMGVDDDGYSANAGFLDYDNDGDLDLFILTNSRQTGPVNYRRKVNDGSSINTDKLYRNNGDGTFTNVSLEVGIICEGYGLGVAFCDVNRDGWTDIYVGNDYITNDLLYINYQGRFVNEIDKYIKHQSKFSMGNDIADINNDGWLDIITLDMLPDNNLRKKTIVSNAGYITYINDERFNYTHQHVRNMLQLNNGDGTFSEIGQLAGVYQTEWSWSPLFADFDNDGYRDLFVTNGFPKDITDRDFISFRQKTLNIAGVDYLLQHVPSVKIPNFAFRNNGDLTFSDVTAEWGLNQPSFANGAAYGDLDNDGDLDYVVNNIDAPVSIYENRLYTDGKNQNKKNHFFRIKLQGPVGNRAALGAKVTLYHQGRIQFAEQNLYRGYLSTVEDVVHFGVGQTELIDSVLIEWPQKGIQVLRNLVVDQTLMVRYEEAIERITLPETVYRPLLSQVNNDRLGTAYKHVEDVKIDFNIQRTLPHKYTQRGPAIAVGDVNGDGLEDFVVGASAEQDGVLFLQAEEGAFIKRALYNMTNSGEDAGLLLVDVDNDGDLDLYAASGSYEFESGSENLQDKLWINNGQGNFHLSNNLPNTTTAGSCVRGADFDGDGDIDLFIGGGVSLGRYPFADPSRLLINDGGKFTDQTESICRELVNPGLVVDALWSDFDNDGKPDLIVVGEFMPVTFFRNTGSGLEKVDATGLESRIGWFRSIQGGDFDADGDTDYIVGNLGLNNYYGASPEHPLTVCAKDFDNNGSVDAVLACYLKSETGQMASYPIHYWDELNSQSPRFRKQFSSYAEFAKTTFDQLFTPDELEGALMMEANHMATSYVENLGNGKFQIRALPVAAQFAPVNGIVVDYINDDEHLDVVLVGNDYANEPTAGQYDAFTGAVLLGDGKGNFRVLRSVESGFQVNGDAKGLVRIPGKNTTYFVATQNLDSLRIFQTMASTSTPFMPNPSDVRVELVLQDGRKQKVELYLGGGYFSQSSRAVSLPPGVKEIVVFDAKGVSRKVTSKPM